MKIKEEIIRDLKRALDKTFLQIKESDLSEIEIDLPKEKAHGDFSTNLAMKLARQLKRDPLDVAKELKDTFMKFIDKSEISKIEIQRPGYINFFLKEKTFYSFLISLLHKPKTILSQNLGRGKRVQIEFVSANPTGPLSVAHGRQAAVGESLARILKLFNFKVSKEYYVNDEGNQIDLLGASIIARLKELKNEPFVFPEDGYQGKYINDIAREILEAERRRHSAFSNEEIAEYGVGYILKYIKEDLKDFGVKFDEWYSQKSLTKSKRIDKVLKFLKAKDCTYGKDGALWFKSTQFGDDKDRVLIKTDGAFTYITPDIAYHEDKFRRGFSQVINIWGPDHHGYIPRITAAVEALGIKRERLKIIIVQLARIFRAGKALVMSTRRAQYITLREVMDEVGPDVAKFFFLTRRTESHLDFDLELAKRQSKENPVYYVQYAYARISGVFKIAENKKIKVFPISKVDFNLLKETEEKELLRDIFRFPFCIRTAYQILDPYPLCQYLMELAGSFHKYYDRHRILLEDNIALANARMGLVKAIGVVISSGLDLLGINAPEEM